MNIEIRKLTPDLAEDYIDFFDNRAFKIDSINKGCYCVWHHWTNEHEIDRANLPEHERPFVKQNYARKLIATGKLNGFVAYYQDKIIGFCNADLKDNYYRHNRENNPETWINIESNVKILSVVCYVIDINMRGKGIATKLLEYVCQYAKNNNYDYVEAYPSFEKFDSNHCGGTFTMYKKQGFLQINGVVRKTIG